MSPRARSATHGLSLMERDKQRIAEFRSDIRNKAVSIGLSPDLPELEELCQMYVPNPDHAYLINNINLDYRIIWDGRTLVLVKNLFRSILRAESVADHYLGDGVVQRLSQTVSIDTFGIHFYDSSGFEIVRFEEAGCDPTLINPGRMLQRTVDLIRYYTGLDLDAETLKGATSAMVLRVDGQWFQPQIALPSR